jgi:hypothetical protein
MDATGGVVLVRPRTPLLSGAASALAALGLRVRLVDGDGAFDVKASRADSDHVSVAFAVLDEGSELLHGAAAAAAAAHVARVAAANEAAFVVVCLAPPPPADAAAAVDAAAAAPRGLDLLQALLGDTAPTLLLAADSAGAADCMRRAADGCSKERRARVARHLEAQHAHDASRAAMCAALRAVPGVSPALQAEVVLDAYGSLAALGGVGAQQLLSELPIDRADAAALAAYFAPPAAGR